MAQIRVKELRFVAPAELASDERNWRLHPKPQRDALKAMVEAVGIVDALIARETPDGLVLVDGHLRRDMLTEQELPVIIVDLDDDEAGQVLATLDPIAAMAKANLDALQQLMDTTSPPIDWEGMMPGAFPATGGWPDMEDEEHPVGVMTFSVTEDQREMIEQAIRAGKNGLEDHPVNRNTSGNALARIADEWLQAHGN